MSDARKEGAAKAREHRQGKGPDPCAISGIHDTCSTVAKLIIDSSGQGRTRARPPQEKKRGPKSHPGEGRARSKPQVKSRAQSARNTENRDHSSNNRLMDEAAHTGTNSDQRRLRTERLVKCSNQEPCPHGQARPHEHRRTVPQAGAAMERARRTSREDSSTSTAAETQGRRQQGRKHLQNGKRMYRSKGWRRYPNNARVHMK